MRFRNPPRIASNPVGDLGRLVLYVANRAGVLAHFAARAVAAMFSPRWFYGQIWRQLVAIGFHSVPVVGLTAIFTGAALALNIFSGSGRLNAEQVMPQIVALGITRELGPVLAALMLSGRVSGAIAAELGAMRATEQIDAMLTLSTDPFRYLVAPRMIAAVIAVPLLTLVADTIGIAGGWLVGVRILELDSILYVSNTLNFLVPWDVGSGLIKGAAFGIIVAMMGCYHGYTSRGGARGVGRATTNAVVSAAILIFAFDYLLTSLFSRP